MDQSPAIVVRSPGITGWPLRHLPGLALCLVLSIAAIELGRQRWLMSHGLSALTAATVLGMAIANIAPSAWMSAAEPGIGLSKQALLRLGIVLYGVKLTVLDIGRVGVKGVLIDVVVVWSTFAIAWLVGTRLLRMDRQTTLLIGAGSSICGAAAVLATQPVVRADADKVTVAIATVVIYGTLAIFAYPVLYRSGALHNVLSPGSHAFGLYEGSTIQEVAQVLAAAQSIGLQATDSAVIAKMVRVMMLAPFLIGLSAWVARSGNAMPAATATRGQRLVVPWFAFLFVAVVGLNSFVRLAPDVRTVINQADLLMLGMAMSGVGLTTRVSSIRRAGFKPLQLGALLCAWLVCGGAAINGAAMRWL